VNALTEKLV